MVKQAPTEQVSAEQLNLLVCAKYIFLNATDELMKEGPFSYGIAINGFQDSVEMVLRVVADYHHVQIKQHEHFQALISKIVEETGLKISHRSCLNQLNQARISFKHFGLPPTKSIVEKFRSDLEGFYPQAMYTFLGVEYDSISIVDLIGHRRVENNLTESEDHLAAGKYEKSIVSSAIAFELYRSYISRNTDRQQFHIPFSADMNEDTELAFQQLAGCIEAHEIALNLLRHQISLADYHQFDADTPLIQLSEAKTLHITWTKKPSVNLEIARFCIKFATDAIFKMKRSDAPNQWRMPPPDREFVVIRDSPIVVWPHKEKDKGKEEVIRIATAGEKLKGYYKNYDEGTHLSIIQNGQSAYIRLSDVKSVR